MYLAAPGVMVAGAALVVVDTLMTVAYFLLIRKLDFSGVFYRRVVRPLSEASYGTYLLHMLILVPVVDCFRQHLSPAATMTTAAVATYVLASAAGVALRRIPFAGRIYHRRMTQITGAKPRCAAMVPLWLAGRDSRSEYMV